MEITINIPKEFENHFNSDKFEDSLQRIRFDIHKAIIARKDILSGEYEIEILDMITEAFLKGTPLPKGHGTLKDVDNIKTAFPAGEYVRTESLIATIDHEDTIIEADKRESEV